MLLAQIEAARFRDAATWVARICPSRGSDPILQAIVIESQGDDIRLSAYDNDTAGMADVAAVVRQPGRVLVSGRLLAAIGKTLDTTKDVSLTDDGSRLRVTSGRNTWELPTLTAGDYPALPFVGDVAAKIDSATLRRAIRRILPAADRFPAGVLHGCVKFVSAGQTLTMVACDRWRVAVATIEMVPAKIDSMIDILVPSEFLDAMNAVLPPESAAAELRVAPGAIGLDAPSQRLLGRLGAGEWPSWERMLPPVDSPVSAVFVVDDLLTALDRATALSDDDNNIVMLMNPDGFEFDAIGPGGAANAEAMVSEYNGEPKRIGIKPRFLRAALKVLESDLAVLRTRVPAGAGLDFVPLGDDGEPVTDYRHVVMPVDPRKVTGSHE